MKLSGRSLSKVDRQSELYKSLQQAHLKIAAKDAQTWGADAAPEAAIRLNWVDLPTTSAALLPQLEELGKRFSSLSRIILCGMGGSSLGPEVIAKTFKKDIFIFDSTDPNYAAHALDGDFSKTLVIVSSKSGSTIETASQPRRSFPICHRPWFSPRY
jgi:glucose-6-phosphate isomerase